MLMSSCDESLPTRQDPSNLFAAQVHPYYNYTPFANNVVIDLIAVNNFDETLSNRAGVDGSLVITSLRDTSVHKTIELSLSNLIRGKYDPVKGILTIDPGDTVVLEAVWDFTEDAGASLTQDFFHYNIDPACRQREMADPESFAVSARSKLYANLGYAHAQGLLTFQQYDVFVGPHDCVPL